MDEWMDVWMDGWMDAWMAGASIGSVTAAFPALIQRHEKSVILRPLCEEAL